MPPQDYPVQDSTTATCSIGSSLGSASADPVVFASPFFLLKVDNPNPHADEPNCDSAASCLVWDVPFDAVCLAKAVDRIEKLIQGGAPSYLITANLDYVMLNHQQPDLRQVTEDADLILANGQPIVWQSRRSGMPLPERVAGSEMIFYLAQRAAERGWDFTFWVVFRGSGRGVPKECRSLPRTEHRRCGVTPIMSPRRRSESRELVFSVHALIYCSLRLASPRVGCGFISTARTMECLSAFNWADALTLSPEPPSGTTSLAAVWDAMGLPHAQRS